MRVMYIHAGKRINRDLKSDEFHVDLFRDRLRLRFEVPSHRNAMQNLLLDSQSSLQMIERLPRGQILGVAIFDATYWFDRSQHMADPWALGPFCYHICDVFRFERGVDASGQLGIWTPNEQAQNEILSQASVQNKLNEWRQRYGDRLYFGKDPSGTPSALTILQPFVEGILCGEKKVENRKRPCFRLHTNTALYNHPKAPEPTQCRFCPADGSKCTYWFHTKDDARKRRLRNHSKMVRSPPSESDEDDDDDDVDMTETEEDYSSADEYKREYNTRSRRKSYQALMASHNLKSESEEWTVRDKKKKNRKRKRSEMMNGLSQSSVASESPPNKKHKKERKKHRKRKKKKKKYDRHKWKSFRTELRFGEDGATPFRMCWHGALMQSEPNPMSDPRDCDLCEETISWDQYYHCDCNDMRTNYCFHHTREFRLPPSAGWKRLNACVERCDAIQRKAMIESVAIPPRYLRKHKKKKKKKKMDRKKMKRESESDDDDDIDLQRTPMATMNGKLCFDPNKMAASFKPSAGVSAPAAAPPPQLPVMNAFKSLPLPLCLNPEAIQQSINVVARNKQEHSANAAQPNGLAMPRGGVLEGMDFSQFPSNITPTMPSGNTAQSMAFNLDSIAINQTQPNPIQAPIITQAIKPMLPIKSQQSQPRPQPQPQSLAINTGQVLSLSQIFNTMNHTNNNNNNPNHKVTPVPSPFAPSPSPTHHHHNNNNNNVNTNSHNINNNNNNPPNPAPHIQQNVYALQSLLNRSNRPTTNPAYNHTITGYNVNIQNQTPQQANHPILPSTFTVNPHNPNPFGPLPTSNEESQNHNNSNNSNSHNNHNTSSENTTENTTTTNTASTSSNSQPKPSIWTTNDVQISNSNHNSNSNTNHTTHVNVNANHKSTHTAAAVAPASYYGVIPPSYQTMPPRAMPYVHVPVNPVPGPNGSQILQYMVPPQAHNMAYYSGLQPFYPSYQYNAQQPNKPAMPVPVPVQQT